MGARGSAYERRARPQALAAAVQAEPRDGGRHGRRDSEPYRRFRAYACEAYNILRKSASLILSLFHLMAGAAIPDVRADPEKVILKLQVSRASPYMIVAMSCD